MFCFFFVTNFDSIQLITISVKTLETNKRYFNFIKSPSTCRVLLKICNYIIFLTKTFTNPILNDVKTLKKQSAPKVNSMTDIFSDFPHLLNKYRQKKTMFDTKVH